MTESVHGTTIIKDVVAISRDGETSTQPWTLEPALVANKRFASIYTSDYRVKEFLGKDGCRMVEHIKSLRNKLTKLKMEGLAAREDPNEPNPEPGVMPDRLKISMIDELPEILRAGCGNPARVHAAGLSFAKLAGARCVAN